MVNETPNDNTTDGVGDDSAGDGSGGRDGTHTGGDNVIADMETWPEDPEQADVPILAVALLPELVADLARQNELHDGRLRTLRRLVDDRGEEIRQLTALVQELAEGMAETVDLTRPSRWVRPFLTRNEASELWQETRWFVDYLITRYPLSTELSIPPCWYRHAVAVDQFDGLYAAWRKAYFIGDRPSSAMLEWREHGLWPTLRWMATAADWRECKARKEHVEPTARQVPTDTGFDEFVAADIEDRPLKR